MSFIFNNPLHILSRFYLLFKDELRYLTETHKKKTLKNKEYEVE